MTVDNPEWIFARAYDNAVERGDEAMRRRIGEAYVPYMEQKFVYFEKQSRNLFGYEIKQVLLLHANTLNADYFGAVADRLIKRGYVFIRLEEALRDQAFRSNDTYIGLGGLSWLDRWALTQGKKGDFFQGEPATPEFVLNAAGVVSE